MNERALDTVWLWMNNDIHFVSRPLRHTKTLMSLSHHSRVDDETRNSHHSSPWLLIFQRMNNKWTLYLPVLLRPTLWLWWFLHEYPAVKLARWQPEKQERRKLIGKGNYEVAKNNAREGLKNNRDIVWICTFWSCKFLSSNWHKINWKASFGLFGQLWLFFKNEKHPQALKVPLQWACCRSPELCPGPHQMHFPAFVPKSAQNCRSRCCRLDQQTSALCGGKKINYINA